jgi:hypothetical protein
VLLVNDPCVLKAGDNRYAGNDPINLIDPTGQEFVCTHSNISFTDVNGVTTVTPSPEVCVWHNDFFPPPVGGGVGGMVMFDRTNGAATDQMQIVLSGQVLGDVPRDGGVSSPSKIVKKLDCAAKAAQDASLAGVLGMGDTPIVKDLAGNSISGMYEAGKAALNGEEGKAATALLLSGTRQGVPGGGPISKGILGVAQDQFFEAITDAPANGGLEPVVLKAKQFRKLESFSTASEVDLAGAVAAGKFIGDTLMFTFALVYTCQDIN